MLTVASGGLPIEELEGKNLSSMSTQFFYGVHVLFIIGIFAIGASLMTVITMLGDPIQQTAEDDGSQKSF